jgi:hypothetical protein
MLRSRTHFNIHDFSHIHGRDAICVMAERIAAEVWGAVSDAATYKTRLAEESITDAIALELAREASMLSPRVQLRTRQLSRDEESRCGADWEWFIGNRAIGWYRYLVQAKKLDVAEGTYPELKRNDRRKRQIAALRAAVDATRPDADEAVPTPLYVLYNGGQPADANASKNVQFGIAALHIEAVEKLGVTRDFTFDALRAAGAIPWQEIFCRGAVQSITREKPARDLPARISGVRSATSTDDDQRSAGPRDGAVRWIREYARYVLVVELTARDTDAPAIPESLHFGDRL